MRYLSLFSGIEAASIAWRPLGWECAAVAEVESFPCAVLAYRFPDVPNLGDVTKITENDIAALGRIDLVVFGSPCQDLSVAGPRRGFEGERSGLFHTAIDIIRWARQRCATRFALWENVPGAFSSNQGRDFAAVVENLAGLRDVSPPVHGWGKEGAALGDDGLLEWAVLDAQHFGVAQRRRRVFALADFGDWASRPPVLLERESLRGDSPPSRETPQDVAGTVAGGARKSGGYSCDDIPLTPETAGTLTARSARTRGAGIEPEGIVATLDASYHRLQGCSGQDLNHGHSHLVPTAFGQNRQAGPVDVSHAIRAKGGTGHGDFESETFLVQAVNGSQDPNTNTELAHTLGRNQGQENAIVFDTTQITHPENRSSPRPGGPCHPLAASAHPPAITGQGLAVRRLTPLECERLQGEPDGWTLIPIQKIRLRHTSTTAQQRRGIYRYRYIEHTGYSADGPRYKAIGNSMAVPVMNYIGRRIDQAMEASK